MGVCGVGIGCLAKTSFPLNEQSRTWTIRAPQRADETRQSTAFPEKSCQQRKKRELAAAFCDDCLERVTPV